MPEGPSESPADAKAGTDAPFAGRLSPLWRLAAWVLLAAALAEFAWRGPWRAFHQSADWSLYYCCAKAWVLGMDPYDAGVLRSLADQAGGAPTILLGNAVSPPMSFAVLAPLTSLPWPAAKAAWLAINLALTVLMAHWLVSLAGMKYRQTATIFLLALLAGLAPLHTGVAEGQLALATAALLVGALRMRQLGRHVPEGLMLALAGLLKPQMAAIFVLYWLYRRSWRGLLVAAAFALAVTAVAVGRLQWAGVDWLASWRASVQACFYGGACDYAVAAHAYVFLNLQQPAYAILGDRLAATAVGWAFIAACLLAGLVAWRRVGERDGGDGGAAGADGGDLLALALLAVAGLLPVYHVFYDAVILALPLAWAARSLAGPLRPYALATITLILPFLVPGAAGLAWLAEKGRPLAGWADEWWWRTLVIPHQPYLLAALSVVLVAALFRSAALTAAGRPPS